MSPAVKNRQHSLLGRPRTFRDDTTSRSLVPEEGDFIPVVTGLRPKASLRARSPLDPP